MTEREKNQIVPRRRAVLAVRCRTMQPILPLCEVRLALARRHGAFVGNIISHPRERIDRRHVRPHRPRQETRRDRKILVVRARHRLARRVGAVERGVGIFHRGILDNQRHA